MTHASSAVLQQARDALASGDPQNAVALLAGSAVGPSKADDNAEALSLLGIAYQECGQPFEAADAIERASLIGPVCDEVRIALASAYAELRRIDLARELYLQLALSRRLSPPMMLQVAAGLAAIDAPELAMNVCEWITEKDDTVAQAYYDMGVYSATSGNELYLTEALTRRALQLEPCNVHFRIGLVSLLVQLHQDDQALIALGDIEEAKLAAVQSVSCLGRIADMLRRNEHDSLAAACERQIETLHQSNELSRAEVQR